MSSSRLAARRFPVEARPVGGASLTHVKAQDIAWDAPFVLLLLDCMGFPDNVEALFGGTFVYLWELMVQGILLLGGALSLLAIFRYKKDSRFPKTFVLLFLLVFFAFLCSALLSSNVPEALVAAIRFFGLVLFALYFGLNRTSDEILDAAIAAQVLLLLLFGVSYLVNPGFVCDSEGTFIGFFSTKNTCAYELGLAIILCYARFLTASGATGRVLICAIAVVSGALCAATNCFGVVVIVVVALALSEVFRRFRWHPRLGYLFLSLNVVFFLVVVCLLPSLGDLMELFGKDVTLTGRIYVWNVLIQMMSESRTWFGYGYSMFWHHDAAETYWYIAEIAYGLGQYTGAHNLFIELWVNVGLFGTVAYIGMSVAGLNASDCLGEQSYVFALVYVLFYSFRSMVERTSNISYDTLVLFVIIGLVLAAYSRRATGLEMQTGTPARSAYGE